MVNAWQVVIRDHPAGKYWARRRTCWHLPMLCPCEHFPTLHQAATYARRAAWAGI